MKTAKTPKVGRKTILSDDLADIICDRLASGESLRQICSDEGMPARSTVLVWLKKDENFRAKCAYAREAQAEAMLEDMADIENDLRSGAVSADVARVLLSSKQWRACKQAPKKYGDKITLGGDPTNPIATMLQIVQGSSIKPVGNSE